MLRRLASVLGLVLIAGATPLLTSPARADGTVLAQQGDDLVGNEEEFEGQERTGQEGTRRGQGSGQAETGAEQDQTREAVEETGPPWTYQMARMSLALLLFLALGIAWMYYRFIVTRRRGEI